jgi:hypothetical protein
MLLGIVCDENGFLLRLWRTSQHASNAAISRNGKDIEAMAGGEDGSLSMRLV